MQEQPLDVLEPAMEPDVELHKPKPRQRNLFKNFKSRAAKTAPKEKDTDTQNEEDDPLAAFSRSAEVMRHLQEEQEKEKERKDAEKAAREEKEAAKRAKEREEAEEDLDTWEESTRKRRRVSLDVNGDLDLEAGSGGASNSPDVGLLTPPRSKSVASPETPSSSRRRREAQADLSPSRRSKAQTPSQSPPRLSTIDQPIALSDDEDEQDTRSRPTRAPSAFPLSLSPSASAAELTSARPSTTPTPIPSAPVAPPAPNPVLSLLIHSPIPSTSPLLVKTRLNKRLKEVRHAWIKKQNDNLSMSNSSTPPPHEITNDNIILTWRNRALFDFTTPKSLGIAVDEVTGEAVMAQSAGMNAAEIKAFKENGVQLVLEALTREALEARKQGRDIYGSAQQTSDGDGRDGAAATSQKQHQTDESTPLGFGNRQTPSPDPGPAPEAKVRIILRSASSSAYPDYKAAAKPSTLISKIVSAFRKKYDVGGEKRVFLMFDGEELGEEMSVGETDIEDGDVVEVVVR